MCLEGALHPFYKVQIEVVINLEMFSVFMSYGNGVKILSPEKAANYLKGVLVESVKAYDRDL